MTTPTSTRRRRPWSRGEKVLACGIVVALVVGVGWSMWLNYINGDPVVHIPTPSMPSPNGYDYFLKAGNNAVEGWPMPYTRPPLTNPTANMQAPVKDPDLGDPKIMAAARQLLKQNATALSTAEQGLQFQYLAPPIRSFAQFPRFAPLRNLARVAAFQARVAAKQGDFDGVVSSTMLDIRMGAELPRGGTLIHGLVGYAIEAIGRRGLWTYVESLDATQCRRTARELEQVDRTRVSYADTLQEEEWSGEASLMEMFRQNDWKSGIIDTSGQSKLSARRIREILRYSMIGKRRVMTDYIAGMDARIAAARLPYGAKPSPTSSNPITDDMMVQGDGPNFEYERTLVQDRLLETVCALRAYKLDHGAYPSTLAQLVPSYLSSVPLDPFTASSTLRYRQSGAKYVLYSIGPDRRDDGGRPCVYDATSTAPRRRYGTFADSKGDIVAGLNL